MSTQTEPVLTPETIATLAATHLRAFAQNVGAGEVWYEGEQEFARAVEVAVLAKRQPELDAMRDALKWNAAALKALAKIHQAHVDDRFVMDSDNHKSMGEILDMAGKALSTENKG